VAHTIYAWYPLLRKLKERGAGNSPLSVFLYNRAIKLPPLPIMIAYFCWEYVLVLAGLTVLGSIAIGYCLGFLVRNNDGLQA